MPGYKRVAVDSMGRVLGDDSEVDSSPGDTLVTSIDAKVQGVVEQQLADTIRTARQTFDKVTGRNYRADSGAVVVMEAKTGRIVAMASQPTYDPGEWVGGISQRQLDRLYAKKSNNPLLSRATQGQFAPGSTWKPFMTTGAISDGLPTDQHFVCGPGLQIGNRYFKNYESESYGSISFAEALNVSCDTFFYQVGLHFWNKYGSNPANANAKDPLAAAAHTFGFGKATGIDIPGVDVTSDTPLGSFGGIAFRHVQGVIHGQVAADEPVAGLQAVAAGRPLVPYETRFDLILPQDPAQADGVLVEAANRGMGVLAAMMSAPGSMTLSRAPGAVPAQAIATGDGFLLAQRLSIARIQWQTEIAPGVVRTSFAARRWDGDVQRAAAFYESYPECLEPQDVARAVAFALSQPLHVAVNELVLMPTREKR